MERRQAKAGITWRSQVGTTERWVWKLSSLMRKENTYRTTCGSPWSHNLKECDIVAKVLLTVCRRFIILGNDLDRYGAYFFLWITNESWEHIFIHWFTIDVRGSFCNAIMAWLCTATQILRCAPVDACEHSSLIALLWTCLACKC